MDARPQLDGAEEVGEEKRERVMSEWLKSLEQLAGGFEAGSGSDESLAACVGDFGD